MTIEAVIDERGRVQLLEPLRPGVIRRALVIVLDERPAGNGSDTARLREAALAGDWERPEEGEAWAYLQVEQSFPRRSFADAPTNIVRERRRASRLPSLRSALRGLDPRHALPMV